MRRPVALLLGSHHALLALFLFAGLELVFLLRHWIFWLFFILLSFILLGISLHRLEEGRFHVSQLILPGLAVTSFLGFALFLPIHWFLHIYFALSAFGLYLLLQRGARQSYPTWNWMLSLLIFFLLLFTIFGWRFYFYLPVITTLVILYAVIGLISWQSLRRFSTCGTESVLVALVIAFALTEIAWALLFLPFDHIMQTAIITTMYYVSMQLIRTSYQRRLRIHDFIEYATVGLTAVVILFLAL